MARLRTDPKDLAQGLGVIAGVIAYQRTKPRVLRAGRRVQQEVRRGRDLAKFAAEESLRRGAAGSKPWIAVGTAVWGVRLGRRLFTPRERILLSEPLAPGERIVITEAPRKPPRRRKARKLERKAARAAARKPSRRQRKRARRAEARAVAEARRAERAAAKAAARRPSRRQRKKTAKAEARAAKAAARTPSRRQRKKTAKADRKAAKAAARRR